MIKDFKIREEQSSNAILRRRFQPQFFVIAAVAVSATLSIFAIDRAEGNIENHQPISKELTLPPSSTAAEAPSLPEKAPSLTDTIEGDTDTEPTPVTEAAPEPTYSWVEHKIKSGESLASIFKAQGLTARLLHNITHSSDEAAELARIRPGQTLRFKLDEEEQLKELVLEYNKVDSLRISATNEGFKTEELHRQVDVRHQNASGTISNSLFVDGQNAGLTDAQVMELAGIFGWDIDFALELRKGDKFSLIFEEHYLDGDKFRNGPIIAAEFINKGTIYRAVRYTDSKGDTSYYDPEGRNKRRAFIRTPVKFARISSRFTNKRWHPVLKRVRSHRGVDYAARTGTPIKSTGNGKVTFVGRKGGYGKVVFIRHGGKYTTVYGHMSRFARKMKRGTKVKQGQVIGYVGATGLASGPHLHYEFRVNGVHRNPLTVKLPKSKPLPKSEMAGFQEASLPLITQLNAVTGIQVAEVSN